MHPKGKLKTSPAQVCGSSHVGFSTGREDDKDLGGMEKTQHYIVLENLEKELCPLTMKEFIHKHTSITPQTYVFPSLLMETYARGAIMVDSITNLKRIYEFINAPNHFITSISGRPWVIAEDAGILNTNLQALQPKHEKNELKIVHLGTEEYRKSKQLKDLYLEFRNHLNGLSERLAMEEENEEVCKL